MRYDDTEYVARPDHIISYNIISHGRSIRGQAEANMGLIGGRYQRIDPAEDTVDKREWDGGIIGVLCVRVNCSEGPSLQFSCIPCAVLSTANPHHSKNNVTQAKARRRTLTPFRTSKCRHMYGLLEASWMKIR